MTREALARRFKPAGFDQPEGSRQNYVKPRPELQEAFYKWVKELPDKNILWEVAEEQYAKACELTERFREISYEESNSLLIDFKPSKIKELAAGLFVSACYNHSGEQIIDFSIDASRIEFIGYKLGKDKVLINSGVLGHYPGERSSGLFVNNNLSNGAEGENSSGNFINNGNVDGGYSCVTTSGLILNNGFVSGEFGPCSSGIAVNNGNVKDMHGRESSGIAINNGEIGGYFGLSSTGILIALKGQYQHMGLKQPKMILRPQKCREIHGLREYIEELKTLSKAIKDEESARTFLEKYGPEPRERIEQDIETILKQEGI